MDPGFDLALHRDHFPEGPDGIRGFVDPLLQVRCAGLCVYGPGELEKQIGTTFEMKVEQLTGDSGGGSDLLHRDRRGRALQELSCGLEDSPSGLIGF